MLLEGGSGIGRTALLAELRSRCDATLHARASPLEREFAFAVVRQLFEARLAQTSRDEREALLGGPARLAAPLFAAGPNLAAGSEYELLQGLHWLCANLAGAGPLLLAIDDVQWADGPSLHFVQYLLGRIEELPVLLVLARSTGEPMAAPALLATIASAPATQVLRLRPLTAEAVAELIAREHDAATDVRRPDADACHAATGGNPFLLRMLFAERGAGREPRPVGECGPASVARDVLARMARCSPHAAAIAQAVAVLAPDAHLRHVAALAGLDEPAALQTAGTLADLDVLRCDETWRFTTPIVRNAIHDAIATSDRAIAHGHAAALLGSEGAPAEQVARHLVHAMPGTDPRAATTLQEAARDALDDARPEEAAAYLRRALAEPAVEDRAGLLAQLGRTELRLSRPDAASERLAAALEDIEDHGRRAEIGLDLGRALVMAGRCHHAVGVLDDLIAELRDAGRDAPRLEAEVTVTTPIGTRAARDLTAGIATAHDDGDEGAAATAARVLLATAAFEAATAGIDARHAVDLARRALCDGVLLAAEGSESLHPYRAAWTLALCDEFDEAEAALDAAASDARAHGSRLGAAAAACFQSALLARRGRLAEADAAARRALASAAAGWKVGVPLAAAFRSAVLVERDELPAAEAVIEAQGLAHAIPGSAGAQLVRYEAGRLRIAQGRLDEGLENLLSAVGADPAARHLRGAPVGAWHAEVATALDRLGRRDEAARVARQGLDQARAFGAPSAIGVALRANGRVDRGADAPRLLREAVAVLRQSPARLELARTLVDLGAVLRRGNGRAAARRELRAGLELAVSCGATALAKRAVPSCRRRAAGRGARCAPA